jgi:rubredoxin
MKDYPYACPVCGKHEYEKIDFYEICPVCGWEDDSYQFRHPDEHEGANKMSLNEARNAYSPNKA